MQYEGQEYMCGITLTAALVGCANKSFYRALQTTLRQCNIHVRYTDIDTYAGMSEEYREANLDDLSKFDQMNTSHFIFAMCIVLNLLGKQITPSFLSKWMGNRCRSYASPLGLPEGDYLMSELCPSGVFCQRVYSDLKAFPSVRRLFFMNIYNISGRSDLLGQGLNVTLTLLRFAELSNWSFIRYWLILLNPDLLMWNEIGKYMPQLCAAYSKYKSLGKMADWCKLILPPQELTEFQSENLSVPFTVAKALSEYYGKGSTSNLKGDQKNPGTYIYTD